MKRFRQNHRSLVLNALCATAAAAALFGVAVSHAAPTEGKKSPAGRAAAKPPADSTSPSALKPSGALTQDEKILQVLNRLGYGPRPGDVERVRAIGVEQYIDQQLHPERIDDSALDGRLASFAELQLSPEQLAAEYHDMVTMARQQQAANKQAKKRAAAADGAGAPGAELMAPTDPSAPAAPGKIGKKRKKLQLDAAGQTDPSQPATPAVVAPAADPLQPEVARKKPQRAAMSPEERQAARRQRQASLQAALPIARAHEEFMAAKALRAAESQRQLQEVLVDFWGNHFNIDIRKQPCGILKIADDRDVIRPHIFGKFRDLLGASAKSPAMLVYLDNFQSMSEQTPMRGAGRLNGNNTLRQQRRRQRLLARGKAVAPIAADTGVAPTGTQPGAPIAADTGAAGTQAVAPNTAAVVVPPKVKKKRPSGLNENYAREIMELHTLGVDGGYTQQDVREVARCFTGWTIATAGGKRPGMGKYAEAGVYRFNPAMHDNGEKHVLGHVIPAGGGESDGEKVLDILASHPATMRHVSEQLCQRLVSDEPPASLVTRCVETWKRTDGDLREVTRTIVTSPEFFSRAAYKSKIKSPFEYAVSSIRALGADYDASRVVAGAGQARKAMSLIKPPKGGGYLDLDTVSLIGQIGTMGEPLFQYQAPTGYPEDSRKWVSSGALISRLNFALALTAGQLGDVRTETMPKSDGSPADIDRAAAQILHAPSSAATRATLEKQVRLASSDGGSAMPQAGASGRVEALLLGSPEFQRK